MRSWYKVGENKPEPEEFFESVVWDMINNGVMGAQTLKWIFTREDGEVEEDYSGVRAAITKTLHNMYADRSTQAVQIRWTPGNPEPALEIRAVVVEKCSGLDYQSAILRGIEVMDSIMGPLLRETIPPDGVGFEPQSSYRETGESGVGEYVTEYVITLDREDDHSILVPTSFRVVCILGDAAPAGTEIDGEKKRPTNVFVLKTIETTEDCDDPEDELG